MSKAPRLARLGDLCDITYGTSAPTVEDGTVPVIGMQHIRDGTLDLANLPRASLGAAEVRKLALRPGDILFNRTNSIEHVGKSAMFEGNGAAPTVFASYLVRLRPHADRVVPAFLATALTAPATMRHIKAMATQGVQQCNINPTRLAAHLSIPLPDLPEQRAVADLASRFDVVLASLQRAVGAKRRLKRALLQQLFGAGARGRVMTLADVVRVRSGNTPSKERADYWGGSFPWISAKDLKRPRIDDSIDHITELASREAATIVRSGTVVILVRGMTLLKNVPVAIATRAIAINQDIKGLEPTKDVDPLFLLCVLSAKRQQLMGFVNRAGHGTGKLDTDRLLSLPLRLPPIGDQQRMSTAVGQVDLEIGLIERQLAAYRQLKRGLMQKLLSNQLSMGPRGPVHGERKNGHP